VGEVHDASSGLDVVQVDGGVAAERNQFLLSIVNSDAECLLTQAVLVDRVQALLVQVVPVANGARYICSMSSSRDFLRLCQCHAKNLTYFVLKTCFVSLYIYI